MSLRDLFVLYKHLGGDSIVIVVCVVVERILYMRASYVYRCKIYCNFDMIDS